MANKPTLQIVGCCATEYSLARVNRNLAIALAENQDKYEISLWGSPEMLDKVPGEAEYKKYPQLRSLFKPNKCHTDIAIYNNFPKSISGSFGTENVDADLRFAYLAWEETIFPERWVKEINQNLHGVFATSEHTAQIFRKSGISIPIINVSEGIDQSFAAKTGVYKFKSDKKFKFFHISSGHYRKGVDVLLKAYVSEFSSSDDVGLVLKVFTNANSEVEKALTAVHELRSQEDLPEIVVINNPDLTDAEIVSLYKQCDAVVLPTRAEGFGMPMAEAFILEKPLITTGYSGHMDFCNAENSFLIDYKLVESQSHLGTPGSMLAEPIQSDLQSKMRSLYENQAADEVRIKVQKAKLRAESITWENTIAKMLASIKNLKPLQKLKTKKLAVVSTINSKCGVAIYSKELYFPIQSAFQDFMIFANSDDADRVCVDQDFVSRTWQYGEKDMSETLKAISDFQADYLHIQYNFSDYKINTLADLITGANQQGIKVLVTLHAVDSSFISILSQLSLCKNVFVHSDSDKLLLNKLGLINVIKVRYGVNSWNDIPKEVLRRELKIEQAPIIASHGLIHDKKGLCELVEAVALLKKSFPQILYLAVDALNTNNLSSSATYNNMLDLIKANDLEDNVVIISDFIKDIEVIRLLQTADLIVLPYADLNEGSSGAVRASFAAHRPVIITNSYIFSNLQDVGFRIVDNQPAKIATAIEKLLSDKALYAAENLKVEKYLAENSWQKSAEEYMEILTLS
jgi:glycosyltransferase involved in cell wall biosynthesis